RLCFFACQRNEIRRFQFGLSSMAAYRVYCRPQEIQVADAGDFDRVLKCEKNTFSGPDLRTHLKQVSAFKTQLVSGDCVNVAAGQYLGERAFPRPVGPHDRVDFAATYIEVKTP